MDDVTRYRIGPQSFGMSEYDEGEWVEYEDYAALRAINAELEAALAVGRWDALDVLNRAKAALQYAEQWDTVSEVNATIRTISQQQEPTT